MFSLIVTVFPTISASAFAAKNAFLLIVNGKTKDWFIKATVSQDSADKWCAE